MVNARWWICWLAVGTGLAVTHTPCPAQPEDAPEDRVRLTGFVDADYSGNVETGNNEFALRQVEIDIERAYGELILLRADLETTGPGRDVRAEQGFLRYRNPLLPQLTLSFGKFNAPVGVEAVDAPEMRTLSHSLLFDELTPLSLTGVMLSAEFGLGFSADVFAVNGWDQDVDVNRSKSFGARFGWRRGSLISAGATGYAGPEDDRERWQRWVVDADVTVKPAEYVTVMVEGNAAVITSDRPRLYDKRWYGGLLLVQVEPVRGLAVAVRGESVLDEHGFLWGGVEETYRGSVTLAPIVRLGYGLRAGVEGRWFFASKKVYPGRDGDRHDTTTDLIAEMVYTF